MTTTNDMAPAPIAFTDAAATKVGELIQEEDNPNLKLRVFISGGGCSGFQYGFTFDETGKGFLRVADTPGNRRALTDFRVAVGEPDLNDTSSDSPCA